MRYSHCPDSDYGYRGYAAENTEPHHAWEACYLLEFGLGHPAEMGDLLCTSE